MTHSIISFVRLTRGLPHYLNTSPLDPDPSTSRSLRWLQQCNLRVKHLQGTEKALAMRSSFLSSGAVIVVIYLCNYLCFWLRCFFVTGCGLYLVAAPWMVVPPDWSADTTFFAGDWSNATKSAMSSFFDLIVERNSKF